MQKNKTPVVIGVSSITQKGSYEDLDEALILMDMATKNAIKDCGNNDIKKYINEINIPKEMMAKLCKVFERFLEKNTS